MSDRRAALLEDVEMYVNSRSHSRSRAADFAERLSGVAVGSGILADAGRVAESVAARLRAGEYADEREFRLASSKTAHRLQDSVNASLLAIKDAMEEVSDSRFERLRRSPLPGLEDLQESMEAAALYARALAHFARDGDQTAGQLADAAISTYGFAALARFEVDFSRPDSGGVPADGELLRSVEELTGALRYYVTENKNLGQWVDDLLEYAARVKEENESLGRDIRNLNLYLAELEAYADSLEAQMRQDAFDAARLRPVVETTSRISRVVDGAIAAILGGLATAGVLSSLAPPDTPEPPSTIVAIVVDRCEDVLKEVDAIDLPEVR